MVYSLRTGKTGFHALVRARFSPVTTPLIAVLGSINMDLVTTTGRRPEPGETVLGRGFTMVPGGKGANQAVAASRGSARRTTSFVSSRRRSADPR